MDKPTWNRVPAFVRTTYRDWLLVAFLVAYSQLEIWLPELAVGVSNDPESRGLRAALALPVFFPLAFRERAPLASGMAVALAVLPGAVIVAPSGALSILAAQLLATYTMASRLSWQWALAGLVMQIVAIQPRQTDPANVAFASIFFGSIWVAGRLVQTRQRDVGKLAARAAELENARNELVGIAVAEERGRIARELHDIVAHAVTTIVIQSQAGDGLIARNPERAHESFVAIEATGRQALRELRTLLGLLRTYDDLGPLSPQPEIGELRQLQASFELSGLRVELEISGELSGLPVGISVAAYRIAQEALTNALRHGRAQVASVFILSCRDRLELTVIDNGSASPSMPIAFGHGLIGIRERATMYGGTFRAGPRAERGFEVAVTLPLGSNR